MPVTFGAIHVSAKFSPPNIKIDLPFNLRSLRAAFFLINTSKLEITMKMMQILTEGLSDILYHSTSLYNVLSILKNNRLQLTPDIGTDAETGLRKKNKIYYMSFARSKMGDYHSPSKYAGNLSLLVFDGRQLKQDGYSGSPVDYWGWGDKDEMEDRLYSKRPYIEDASKYIKEIHVFYKKEQHAETNAKNVRWLRSAYIMAKRAGVEMYVYDDVDAFKLLNKKKSVSISTLQYDNSIEPSKPYFSTRRNYFAPYMELLSVNDKTKLSSDAKRILYNIDGWNKDDAVRSLAADIHNERKSPSRPNLDKFLAKASSLKLNTVSDIINYIDSKFKE